jgi:hypothetical protein
MRITVPGTSPSVTAARAAASTSAQDETEEDAADATALDLGASATTEVGMDHTAITTRGRYRQSMPS